MVAKIKTDVPRTVRIISHSSFSAINKLLLEYSHLICSRSALRLPLQQQNWRVAKQTMWFQNFLNREKVLSFIFWSFSENVHFLPRVKNPLNKNPTSGIRNSFELLVRLPRLQSIAIALGRPQEVEEVPVAEDRHLTLKKLSPEALSWDRPEHSHPHALRTSFHSTRSHHASFQRKEATNSPTHL